MPKFLINIAFLILLFGFNHTVKANIDSLKKVVKSQKNDSLKANIFNKLAFEYRYKKIDSSMYFAKSALVLADKVNYKKGIADANFNLGLIHFIKKNTELSLKFFFEALKIREKIKDRVGIGRIYNYFSIIYRDKGETSLALDYTLKALRYNSDASDSHAVAVNYKQAAVLFKMNEEYKKAEIFLNRGLKISEMLLDTSKIIAYYTELGDLALQQNKYNNAIIAYSHILKLQQNKSDYYNTASAMLKIGSVFEHEGELIKALEYYQKATIYADSLKNVAFSSQVYQKIGLIYSKQGNYQKALANYQEALKFNLQTNEKFDLINIYARIGDVYREQDRNGLSFEYFERARALAEKLKATPELVEIYWHLSQIYGKMKDTNRAYSALLKFTKFRDSLFNSEKQKLIKNLEFEHKSDKQELEFKRIKDKNDFEAMQARIAVISTLVGIILITLIISIMKNRNQEKEDSKKKISLDEEIIELQAKEIAEIKTKMLQQKKNIKDSLGYAHAVQHSVLPWDSTISEHIQDFFIVYAPKDFVSGDFYWFAEQDNSLFVAVVDCTGHGVPGAFMTMLGSVLLNSIVKEYKTGEPAVILNILDAELRRMLKNEDNNNTNPGEMEVCLIRIDNIGSEHPNVLFAGAKRPLYYVINNELFELKGDKITVGSPIKETDFEFSQTQLDYTFKNHYASNSNRVTLYLASDGFINLMSPSRKKFGTKALKELIEENSHLNMHEQQIELEKALYAHKQYEDQIDDITILGIRLI